MLSGPDQINKDPVYEIIKENFRSKVNLDEAITNKNYSYLC